MATARPATVERQVALESDDGRLEDVGHQPGDEQDHGRTGERPRRRRSTSVMIDAEEGDHDEPEESRASRRDTTLVQDGALPSGGMPRR